MASEGEMDVKLEKAISALSTNVEQLKTLASLVTVTQSPPPSAANGTKLSSNNVENIHPNVTSTSIDNTPLTYPQFDDLLIQMQEVEAAVSSLEEKMLSLKTVVSEETELLDQLEKTRIAATSQKQSIGIVKEGMAPLSDSLPGGGGKKKKKKNASDPSGSKDTSRKNKPNESMNKQASQTSATTKTTQSSSPPKFKKNDKDKIPWGKPLVTLEPLTAEEFNAISRNVRGRVKLSVLNEAMADITAVAHRKYEILLRKHLKSKPSNSNSAAAKKQIRESTKQYKEALGTHRRLIMDDHGDEQFVSEQELRDSCAFFRLGESTARNLLQLLRSVQRLKQVHGPNSVITYILLEKKDE